MGILFGLTIKLLRNQWKLGDLGQAKDGEINIRRSTSDRSIKIRRHKLWDSLGEKTGGRTAVRVHRTVLVG